VVLQFWQFWDSVHSKSHVTSPLSSFALISSYISKTWRSGSLLISCSNFCDANLDADFCILAKECKVFLPQFCSQCVQFVSTVIAWGSQYSATSGTVFSGHYILGTLFSHPGYPGIVLYWQSKRCSLGYQYSGTIPSQSILPLQNFASLCRLFICACRLYWHKIMSQGNRTWSSMAAEKKLATISFVLQVMKLTQ